jgi:hypothetical protein
LQVGPDRPSRTYKVASWPKTRLALRWCVRQLSPERNADFTSQWIPDVKRVYRYE